MRRLVERMVVWIYGGHAQDVADKDREDTEERIRKRHGERQSIDRSLSDLNARLGRRHGDR